jgi:hypothetical protein
LQKAIVVVLSQNDLMEASYLMVRLAGARLRHGVWNGNFAEVLCFTAANTPT